MSMSRLTNEIPSHLLPFVTEQDPSLYCAIDHANWRFILRISQAFFRTHAHQKYLDGLRETGISTDRIPLIAEMDLCLRKFGWRAVGVVGFIPPAVFMEFQSLGILPIACDMRSPGHLAYTPAPDIVHEAAGHAPILADPTYAAYLREYGEVARKAIYSKNDQEVYEAIRNLSDVKENPNSQEEDIVSAQKRLDNAIASNEYVSEATYLSRMNWWTVEYGLVGDLEDPLIYGAGLLSSVGESYTCLSEKVKKIPLTLDSLNTSYDITRPQPQLFVAPNFEYLTEVLHQMAKTMAFQIGGIEGLTKAKMAETVTTTVLSTGIQLSGVLTRFLTSSKGEIEYLQLTGPCQLSYQNQELEGHSGRHHAQGYGTPIGLLKDGRKTSDLSEEDLRDGLLEFASGIRVEGRFESRLQREGKNILLTFSNCTVSKGDKKFFEPEWGVFDLACGETIPSVFGGAADRGAYVKFSRDYRPVQASQKTNLTSGNKELNQLYQEIRDLRSNRVSEEMITRLDEIAEQARSQFPEEWLLKLELLEFQKPNKLSKPWMTEFESELKSLAQESHLIQRGINLL